MSERRLCGLLGLNRSTVWHQKNAVSRRVVNLKKEREKRELVDRMREVVKEYPTWATAESGPGYVFETCASSTKNAWNA